MITPGQNAHLLTSVTRMQIYQEPIVIDYKEAGGEPQRKVLISAAGTIHVDGIAGLNLKACVQALKANPALSSDQHQVLSDLYRNLVKYNFFKDGKTLEKLHDGIYPDYGTLPEFQSRPATYKINALGTVVYNLLKHPEVSKSGYRLLGGILLFLIRRGGFAPYWDLDERQAIELQEKAVNSEVNDAVERLKNEDIPETEREQLVMARRGQGRFRAELEKIESVCRLTCTTDSEFLVASHIKPWRLSSNSERLDRHNGLLLAPHVDRLFDLGWISFSENGAILLANEHIRRLMIQWGLDPERNVGSFNMRQQGYLEFHRKNIYKA